MREITIKNSNDPFFVLRDFRVGSIRRLVENDDNDLDGTVFDEFYNLKDQYIDCLLILGLLETLSFIIRPAADLRDILDQ